jgi:hypothetical protein
MTVRRGALSTIFPPEPQGLRGRRAELRALSAAIDPERPGRLALVGSGGSGKSLLACALGHRVARSFRGQIHWFRVGGWDPRTLGEMLAIRFGVRRTRARLFERLRRHLASMGPAFIVLDNHEDDRAMSRLLDELRDAPVTWIITARRCLLAGVAIYPVTAPLVTRQESAFSRVASLTKLLRYNPLALDIAEALVATRAAGVEELKSWLLERGVDRVRVVEHEDDLPEVALLVEWAFARLDPAARRMLAVLARIAGDHVDRASLERLARAKGKDGARALGSLCRWHLVQEPFAARYALHAVVRHAIARRTSFDPKRIFEHYLGLLERQPERLDLEQTHLFAAMDYAHAMSDLGGALRIDRLLSKLGADPVF